MESEKQAERTPEPSPDESRSERRRHVRLALDESASLLLVHQCATIPCRIMELSLGGCRLCTAERFSGGVMARVEVAFKVLGVAFRLPGVTQWTDHHRMAGIRFVDMTPRRGEALAELLTEVEAYNAAKAKKHAAEKDSANDLVPIKPAGFGQVKGHASRTEPALQASAARRVPQSISETRMGLDAFGGASPARPDLRMQPRHAVDTRAVIHLIDLAAVVDGRILDLSLGGCCIHTHQRFPLGIFRKVETEFCLEGLPFRLGGVTQALHDRYTVGIRFLDMSERKREQLVQLIEEIEELLRQERAADESTRREAESEPSPD